MGDYLSKITDEKISKSIVFFFLLQDINASLKNIFEFSDDLSRLISMGTGLLILFFLMRSFTSVWKRKHRLLIQTILLFTLLYGVSIIQTKYIRGEDIGLLLTDSALWTFAFWIPIGVYTSAIEDYSILYKTLLKYSWLITFFLLITFVWFYLVGSKQGSDEYNMFFSYALVLPLLFHLNEYIVSKKKIYGIVALIQISAILLYGSRGAFLCIAGFFILKMFLGKLSGVERKQYIFLFIFISLLLIYLFINNSALEALGFKSRLIQKMSDGEATSGREYVWQAGAYLISVRPLFGYGIGGEFYQMSMICEMLTGVMIEEYSSLTPHNGFLQLMLNFGIPIGFVVSLYILLSLKRIKLVSNHHIKDLIIILFATYILPSFIVSDGIFIKPGIAVYLFFVSQIKSRRYEYSKSQTKNTR